MNTVVYYPHICPTPEWLRLASLCWDKVYRITPPTAPDDPEAIQELDKSLGGILVSINAAEIVESAFELKSKFINWLEARAETIKRESKPAGTQNLEGLFRSKIPQDLLCKLEEHNLVEREPYTQQIPRWEQSWWNRTVKYRSGEWISTPFRDKPKPFSPHANYEGFRRRAEEARQASNNKEAALYNELADNVRGNNMVTVTGYSNMIYVPADVALHYLALCASKIAMDGNRDLAADGEIFTDTVFYDVRHARGEVATSVLQAYLPKDFYAIEPHRIAEFRESFASKRLEYEKEVQSIAREFAEVASEGELRNVKNRIISLAKERVEETKTTYKRAKLEMIVKTFGVSITPPALIASITSALGIGIFAPAAFAAALSLLAASKFIEWDKAKSDREKSPWSYVIDSAGLLR
jgi:hypothetical protein